MEAQRRREEPDYNRKEFVFAIVNIIFFFPLFWLWGPALYYSMQKIDKNDKDPRAKYFNIACASLGKSFSRYYSVFRS